MQTHNEEREKLREIQAVFEAAVENNTIDDLRPYTDTEFSFVSLSDRSFSDFDTFSLQWGLTRKQMVGSGRFTTHLNPQPSLFCGDIAICYGNSENKMLNSKGQIFDFTSHWTVVFRRKDGEWKVLRAHNSLNPFSNPMTKHAVKAMLVKVGVLAFIGGALCSLLMYLLLT